MWHYVTDKKLNEEQKLCEDVSVELSVLRDTIILKNAFDADECLIRLDKIIKSNEELYKKLIN